MKKRLVAFILLCVTMFALVSCNGGSSDPDGFKGSYKTISISSEVADETAIINAVAGGTKYTATYKSTEYTKSQMTGMELEYTDSYDLTASINLDAEVGGVLAYYVLKNVYDEGESELNRDNTFEICIVRVGEGQNYSDYKVYLKYGENTYSATLTEMQTVLDESGVYFAHVADGAISDAFLDSENNYNYFELILSWGAHVSGEELTSFRTQNLLTEVNHDYCKGGFISALNSMADSNQYHTYLFAKSGEDRMYKFIDDMNYEVSGKTVEKSHEAQYIKLNGDSAYSYYQDYTYERTLGSVEKKTVTRTLAPLSGTIELPEFAS